MNNDNNNTSANNSKESTMSTSIKKNLGVLAVLTTAGLALTGCGILGRR